MNKIRYLFGLLLVIVAVCWGIDQRLRARLTRCLRVRLSSRWRSRRALVRGRANALPLSFDLSYRELLHPDPVLTDRPFPSAPDQNFMASLTTRYTSVLSIARARPMLPGPSLQIIVSLPV